MRKPIKAKNESDAINSLHEILGHFLGGEYETENSPDETNFDSSDVDFILRPRRPGGPMLAVEHTIVEGFGGQMSYIKLHQKLIEEFNERLAGRLPEDRCFVFCVPKETFVSLTRKRRQDFLDLASDWIKHTANGLVTFDDLDLFDYDGISSLLICQGPDEELNGTIDFIQYKPADADELKRRSVQKAIEHGIGKFRKYKSQQYSTILILEDTSGSYISSRTIADEMLGQYKDACKELIDHIIIFVSTDQRMVVGRIWKENKIWYDDVPYERIYTRRGGSWHSLSARK